MLVCAALAGCGADEPLGPDSGTLPVGELLVGGAENDGTGFVELADGADAELVPGAQGGFHVWINVRVLGVAGPLYLEREARRASDGALVLAGSRQALEVSEDAMEDWWENPAAAPSFMCPAPVGITVFDTPLQFSVTLSDPDGNVVAEDEITLVPRCPTGEQAAFCLNVCDG
jgi:hypothetical protein